jgi:hypothetical protein
VTVFVRESGEGVDTEINTHRLLTRCFSHLDFDFADEVQFPLVTRPDRPNLLNALYGREVNVGARLVLAEDEVRPVVFEV